MNNTAAARTAQELDALDDQDSDCFETFEDVKEKLDRVEQELAARLKIRRHVRRELIALDRANKLVEDELVARWHELYSNYAEWARSETWEEPPIVNDEESEKGAAEAALAVVIAHAAQIRLTVQAEPEADGRWIGEVPELSGVLVYGSTPEEASSSAKALALHVLADRVEHGEVETGKLDTIQFVAAA